MPAPAAPPLRVLLAAMLSLAALPGCATTVVSPGADAADTASEQHTTGGAFDDKIKIELIRLMADDSAEFWKDVSTTVYRGRVLLLGSVETAAAKTRAGAIGGQPEGVIEVINDIQVTDAGGVGAFVNDVAIEESIRAKYLFAEGIDSANFRVRSINGTVTLIGLAETRAELDRA
ncbi:MAG: BON domain-containing protein, partial [Alphaproteobacteria bacterium]